MNNGTQCLLAAIGYADGKLRIAWWKAVKAAFRLLCRLPIMVILWVSVLNQLKEGANA